jgi:hypothetical protein
LKACTNGLVVFLRLDDRNGNVRFDGKDVISTLSLTAAHQFPTDNYSTFGKAELFPDLVYLIPTSRTQGRCNVLRANITLT